MELILEKNIIAEIGQDNLKQFLINTSDYNWKNQVTIQLIEFDSEHLDKLKTWDGEELELSMIRYGNRLNIDVYLTSFNSKLNTLSNNCSEGDAKK